LVESPEETSLLPDIRKDAMNRSENKKIRPLIVIPVFNHAGTLRDVVVRTLSVCSDVLVLDDGSTDGSAEVIEGLPIHLVRHEKNRGKGAAILTAAKEAGRLGMTHMITLDADGQHDPADFSRFLPVIQENPLAIAVGKRILKNKRIPISSRFYRHFSNFWFRVQTGSSLKDTQCGFRAYPVAVLAWLELHDKGYSFEKEVLVKAAWAGIQFKEVDVSIYYPPSGERISHFRFVRDTLARAVLNIRLTIWAIAPIPSRPFLPLENESEKITIRHPVESLRILLRRKISQSQLAISAGFGVFLGTLPLIGFWTLTILITASYFRLNKYVALVASQLCYHPVVPALCIEAGYYIRHGKFLTEISLTTLGYQGLERIFEWIIGSLVLGPLFGVFIGGLIYVVTFSLKKEKSVINA